MRRWQRRKSFWEKLVDDWTIFGELRDELWLAWRFVEDIYYNIRHFVNNCWNWRRVLWKDRNWDSDYVYYAIEQKIRMQADKIEKYGCHLHKDRDVKRMRICAELLRRARENDYYFHDNPFYDRMTKKWGELEMEEGERTALTVQVKIFRPGVKTERDVKMERFWHKKANDYAKLMTNQDLELFGKLFARWSKSWWD